MYDALLSWLPTYLLHSTALLGALWALERTGILSRLTHGGLERLWRMALFGGLASATLVVVPWGVRPNAPPSLLPTEAVAVRGAHASDTARASVNSPVAVPVAAPAAATPPIARRSADARSAWAAIALTLATLWLAVAVFALARLAAQWRAVRAAVAACAPLANARWHRLAADVARSLRVRTPRIVRGAAWHSPVLAPGRVLCLPDWSLDADDDTVRAILVHELAHLRRHDLAWRVLHEVVSRLLWLQPLNRIAIARLELQAELACDAHATGLRERTALAESLLRCAERMAMPSPRLACAVAGERSPLAKRVRTLLMGADTASPAQRRLRAGTAIAALVGIAVAVPVVAVRQDDVRALLDRVDLPNPGDWIGEHMSIMEIESPTDAGNLSIRLHGRATFNEQGDAFATLAGTLRVHERSGGLERTLVAKGNRNGGIDYAYAEGGQPRPLEGAARTWLTGIVGQVSEVLADPRERARTLMARGGIEAVLANLERQGLGDYGRQQRIEALLALPGPLAPASITRAVAATTLIEGGHERREALTALAGALSLDDVQQAAWLRSAAGIHDDFELRETLASLAPKLLQTADVLAAWRGAVDQIRASFDLREALREQLGNDASTGLLAQVIEASERIGDDFERREALVAAATHVPGDDSALVGAFVRASEGIHSDFDRHEALVALLARPLAGASLLEVVRVAARIEDSQQRLDLLKRVAQRAPHDAQFAAQIREAGRGMGGMERGELELALDALGS
jgi:beta-lactamase regulating signal transducer with metallopeptidase domain